MKRIPLGSRVLIASLLALTLAPLPAFSFSEMVRHGYASCTACHTSPDGGGLLTPYGRVASAELLSSAGDEKEARFLYGALTSPDWLQLQADYISIATYKPATGQKRYIIMQADIEAAVQTKQFTFVTSFGYSDDYGPQRFVDGLLSRRHYVKYQPSDNLSLRVGRFNRAFGLNIPDHIRVTKRNLEWDERTETYNVEAAWMKEPWEVFVTAQLGRPDKPSLDAEKGGALRGAYYFAERHKVGFSYFFGTNKPRDRHVFGPFAVLGFTKQLVLLAELDFEPQYPSVGKDTWGIADYLRLSYEVTKGLHVFGTQEFFRRDLGTTSSEQRSFGLGAQWFPRPHFELQVEYQFRTLGGSTRSDWAWLFLRAYL